MTSDGTVTDSYAAGSGGGLFMITSGPDGNLWFTAETGNRIGTISR